MLLLYDSVLLLYVSMLLYVSVLLYDSVLLYISVLLLCYLMLLLCDSGTEQDVFRGGICRNISILWNWKCVNDYVEDPE